MILTTAIRKQMREAARLLMSGATSTSLQKALRELPEGLATPRSPMPDFLRNMASNLPNMPNMRDLPNMPNMPDLAEFGTAKGVGASGILPDFFRNLPGQAGIGGAHPQAAAAPGFRPSPTQAPRPASEAPVQQKTGANEGQFLARSFTNHAGTRDYKLYIPASYHGQPLPLVVMLHGCTQNPDDFANGTRMNQLAEEKQCFVVYPAQTTSANSSKCWNWFKSPDQQRGKGEPAIIAGITQEVVDAYKLDGGKVYIAGLSAGGAMAVIMATTYPDLYSAVGVHSGLPYGCAADLPSALAAMRGGTPNRPASAAKDTQANPPAVPIIIFHGDSDTTVHMRNGERLMKQSSSQQPDVLIGQGQVPDGHRYTCTSHHGNEGQLLAEHWVIHGAGHAWAGGCKSGSYTDPKGPDATREMLRFFYAQGKPGCQN